MPMKIKSADIHPGDIVRFEYGAYDNWVTVRIDEVNTNTEGSYYSQKLIWHYLSDEDEDEAPKDCRAEKLGNNPAQPAQPTYRQFICYSNPNSIVEKIQEGEQKQ